jgi:hypothetical protein
MTVKGIAEAVGKSDQSVLNWIIKIVHPNFLDVHRKNLGVDPKNAYVDTQNAHVDTQNAAVESIRLKAGSKDPHHPADYTLEEASLIIETGLGKNAAGVWRANLGMAAELARIKEKLLDYNGFRADFQKFLESGNQKALPDPKEAAYQELEKFVERTLEVEPAKIHRPSVQELYHAYEKEAQNPIGKQDFMFTIALKHPEFELKLSKKEWYFTRCYVRRII